MRAGGERGESQICLPALRFAFDLKERCAACDIIGAHRTHQRQMHAKMRGLRGCTDAQLLNRDAKRCGRRGLRADTAIERQILRLARNLCLQVADQVRHFRLFARKADALRVNLGEPQIELVLFVFQLIDLDFKLRALLRNGEPVVAGVIAAEFIDDVERKRREQHHHDGEGDAAHRRIGAHDDRIAAGVAHGTERAFTPSAAPSRRRLLARGA